MGVWGQVNVGMTMGWCGCGKWSGNVRLQVSGCDCECEDGWMMVWVWGCASVDRGECVHGCVGMGEDGLVWICGGVLRLELYVHCGI